MIVRDMFEGFTRTEIKTTGARIVTETYRELRDFFAAGELA